MQNNKLCDYYLTTIGYDSYTFHVHIFLAKPDHFSEIITPVNDKRLASTKVDLDRNSTITHTFSIFFKLYFRAEYTDLRDKPFSFLLLPAFVILF